MVGIKIGQRKASKATLGYGKKSVEVKTKYGRMIASTLNKAKNAISRFGSKFK